MVEAKEDLKSDLTEESWMDPIIDYLKNSKEPGDKNQATKLWIKAAIYTLLEGGFTTTKNPFNNEQCSLLNYFNNKHIQCCLSRCC